MVLAASLERWLKEKEAKRRRERDEGIRAEVHREWTGSFQCRLDAEANGEPFDEPTAWTQHQEPNRVMWGTGN